MSFLVGKAASSGLLSSILKIALIGGGLYLGYRYLKPRLENIIPEFPSLPSLPEITLPSLPEITLPTIPENILPEITLPTIPENILPEITLPTIPTLPDLTEIGKMEIPINIPSADDVMNFFKSPTGQQVADEIIPEVIPEVQGALVGADIPLLMEVIRSQNPRETRLPTGEVVPPAPPVPAPTMQSIDAELERRAGNSRNRRFA